MKKFLDLEGLKFLWSKISMEDYPNNETLIAILNAIDTTKANKDDIKQADWSQNDSTALDYIKNRTHWINHAETLLDSEVFECTTLASDSESYYGAKSGNIGLVSGNKYNVTVNGTTYTAVPALNAFGTNDISLMADIKICRIYDRENGTVEVFSDTPITLTISIEDAEDIYVKLDERFIPDGFARSEDVESKMDKENPAGFGSLSMNRASGSVIGENSVAIGTDCIASGTSAVAIGSGASAAGFSSYAEGSDTVANGDLAHAEGSSSKATGYASHAECSGEANGNYSHATGYSIADGDYSHASGNGTWAIGRSQTVIGEANIEDVAEDAATRGTYAVIVGNGDMDAGEFSNAATVDWGGTAWFAGSVKVGGTGQDDVSAKELITQEHVQEQLTAFENRILPRMTKITLPVSGWDTNALTQTVAVNGISADETSQLVTTRPIGDSISPAIEAGVYCKSQGENKLTFSCLIQPTYDIDYMVTWQNVVYILPTHTVTFYNDDGSVVLYVDKVNEGSDATYVGDIPTKDSDGVYDYNFIGWSLTIGGDIDESALVNVVSNRNVYAVFEKTEIEVVSGGWVPFCADGTTWMGEQVAEAQINTKPVIITDVVLSETNQYRLTVDGTEYICIRNEENDGYSISCDGCPVTIKYDESLGGWYFADDDSDTRFSGTLKVEVWIGSEPYVPEGGEDDVVPELLSWEGVEYHINKGDYKDVYTIGDMVPVDLGSEGVINMQIAAFDTDELADGSGTAAITWIAKELLNTKKKWNSTYEPTQSNGSYLEGTGTIGGWEKSLLRTYLRDDIYSLIPTTAKCLIRNVTKSHSAYDTTGTRFTQTTEENVWIPNYDEVIKTDCTYKALFPDNSSKVKYLVSGGSAQKWWIRSVGADSLVHIITTSGAHDAFGANNKYGVCIAFCTGVTQNADQGGGYVPTDGYQAFTTDGTWTGEEVTTAVSVPDFTNYKTSFLQADIQWKEAPSVTISNDTIILIWVNNVCYTCSATVVGNPKSVYCFTCDGCPAAVIGGLGVGNNNWRVAFTTAGTYKLKVEVKTA